MLKKLWARLFRKKSAPLQLADHLFLGILNRQSAKDYHNWPEIN